MLVNLDGAWFNTDLISVIRPVDDGDKQCSVFLSGSSPVDGGFLVDLPLDDVLDIVRNAELHHVDRLLENELDSIDYVR